MDHCPCISFVEVSEVLNVAKISTQQLFSESLLYRLILVDNAIRLVKRESFFSFFAIFP